MLVVLCGTPPLYLEGTEQTDSLCSVVRMCACVVRQ